MPNACFIWDWTLKAEGNDDEVISCLREVAKDWKFQLEKAEGGYLHYQGRLSLFKKKRKCELVKLVQETVMSVAWFGITSNNGSMSNYMCKLDTRVRGPWSSDDD